MIKVSRKYITVWQIVRRLVITDWKSVFFILKIINFHCHWHWFFYIVKCMMQFTIYSVHIWCCEFNAFLHLCAMDPSNVIFICLGIWLFNVMHQVHEKWVNVVYSLLLHLMFHFSFVGAWLERTWFAGDSFILILSAKQTWKS